MKNETEIFGMFTDITTCPFASKSFSVKGGFCTYFLVVCPISFGPHSHLGVKKLSPLCCKHLKGKHRAMFEWVNKKVLVFSFRSQQIWKKKDSTFLWKNYPTFVIERVNWVYADGSSYRSFHPIVSTEFVSNISVAGKI